MFWGREKAQFSLTYIYEIPAVWQNLCSICLSRISWSILQSTWMKEFEQVITTLAGVRRMEPWDMKQRMSYSLSSPPTSLVIVFNMAESGHSAQVLGRTAEQHWPCSQVTLQSSAHWSTGECGLFNLLITYSPRLHWKDSWGSSELGASFLSTEPCSHLCSWGITGHRMDICFDPVSPGLKHWLFWPSHPDTPPLFLLTGCSIPVSFLE